MPTAHRSRGRLLAAALGCTALLATGTTAAATAGAGQAAGPSGGPAAYVALGDSYAAAPLVPAPDPSSPACLRSRSNYPRAAADALGARLTDVSCSGARVTDFSDRQFGIVRAQYEALTPDTGIVSLTIGGNDTDLVATAVNCVNTQPEPAGVSCADRYTSGGRDQVAERIDAWAPELGRALDEIHRRAPRAKVFVVGYGDFIRKGGCHPVQPVWSRDADYIQGQVNHLNQVLRTGAEAHGAAFVDTFSVSTGHDSCAPAGTRYLEGLVPTEPALSLHPNAAGSAVFGAALADAVRKEG